MEPRDIGRVVNVGAPALSPDGSLVAFVVARVDMDANNYRSAIWLAATDGSSPPEPFTLGRELDGTPVWSPDGRRLAFTSQRGDGTEKATLHVAPVQRGGEVLTIAQRAEGISGIDWSPDGRRLVFTSRVRDERLKDEDPRKQPPRRVDRLRATLNGEGFIIDRPMQLFVTSADGLDAPFAITSGPYEHANPKWSPDGEWIAFDAARHTDWDLLPACDLWVVRPDGRDLKQITETRYSHGFASWSNDGLSLAAYRTDDRDFPCNFQVEIVEIATGVTRDLTTSLNRTCAPFPGAQPPKWTDRELFFAIEDRGDIHIYRVPIDGSTAATPVVGGQRQITSYDRRADRLVYTATNSSTLPELFAIDGSKERRLTHVSEAFHTACPSHPTERFAALASDGEVVDAWCVRATDLDVAQKHPAVLLIHGGPWTQFGNRWFDEVQLYASAGYVVLYANPRGSSGRHDGWGRAIRGPVAKSDPGTGWGGVDYTDLMAVVDDALRRYPFIDAERLGVLGGSYGGYMTSWIVGHTKRFKAAISERAVNNLLSLEWTSDIAGMFRFEHGVDQFERPDEYIRMSPITYVRDIETPVLIIHSEDDLRCPIEQAEQLFIALRMFGKPVEFVRFPAETHELSRSGSPIHRVQRAEIVLEWFGRHLKSS